MATGKPAGTNSTAMVVDQRRSNEAPADEIFLDRPWITIRWDNAHSCLHSDWKAFATSVEFRAALTEVVAAIRSKKAVGYVSDARRLKVIVRKDQEWAHGVWAPAAVQAGLQRLAFVTADSGMG